MHWGYKFTNVQEMITHLVYIDDIKLFAKKEKNEDSRDKQRLYSRDIERNLA